MLLLFVHMQLIWWIQIPLRVKWIPVSMLLLVVTCFMHTENRIVSVFSMSHTMTVGKIIMRVSWRTEKRQLIRWSGFAPICPADAPGSWGHQVQSHLIVNQSGKSHMINYSLTDQWSFVLNCSCFYTTHTHWRRHKLITDDGVLETVCFTHWDRLCASCRTRSLPQSICKAYFFPFIVTCYCHLQNSVKLAPLL